MNNKNIKVAILATDGFEQVELTEPKKALQEAGFTVEVVSPKEGKIKAWDKTDWGTEVQVDKTLQEANVDEYDGLVLPGGQINPDKLRTFPEAVEFVKNFHTQGKTIAAICHGPWLLIEAGIVSGKNLTSYHSIQTDVRNAGGNWSDQELVIDGNLITSRNPGDIPVFNNAVIEAFTEVVKA